FLLERRKGLRAKLIAIADKQGAGELASIGKAAEHVDGNERLACAGGQREQRTLGLVLLGALGDLFKDGADGSVLVVPSLRLAALVGRDERLGDFLGKREAHDGFVSGA